ncbi:MAG: type II secretion system protein GspG [Nitrospira sp.]|nr:type II secretion system protein GspG [Nitrospira sp.]
MEIIPLNPPLKKSPFCPPFLKGDIGGLLWGKGGFEKGFTLLEIIVVVFILSLLAAIIAPRIIGRTDDARITEAKVQIRNFETALKLFKLDNGFYPSTDQGLEALVEKPTIGRIPNNYREGGYLEQKKIPLDPWGNPYIYVSPGIQGDFDILSFGADGKEGGEGKDADIKNWEM